MRGFRLFFALTAAVSLYAVQVDLKSAEELYSRTDYSASLRALRSISSPGGPSYFLYGRNYFMLSEYRKACDYFYRALAIDPKNSDYALWLGRAYGRRAESASMFTAPLNASKARQYFEMAVALDPSNHEAVNDLFDYYLEAPGFLGGGFEKAAALVKSIEAHDPAEGHFAEAQLADRRKEFDAAENHLRRAMELAPRQVGRVIDLAKYLAKRGRYQESEAVFERADQIAPNSPKVMFARAHTYVQQNRNLDRARTLLRQYLQCELTPDDPPREAAEKLLKQTAGG